MSRRFSWAKRIFLTTSLVLGLLLACLNISANANTNTTNTISSAIKNALSSVNTYAKESTVKMNANNFVTTSVGANVAYIARTTSGNYPSTYYDYFSSLSAAVSNARSGETIHLVSNTTECVSINKYIFLDLNGYTISKPSSSNFAIGVDATVYIYGEGTIFGGSGVGIWVGSSGYAQLSSIEVISNSDNAIYNLGKTLVYDGTSVDSGSSHAAYIGSSATLTLESGYMHSTDSYAIQNDGTFKMSGGTLESEASSSATLYNNGTATITGGQIRASEYEGIRNCSGKTLSVSNAIIWASNNDAIYNQSSNTLTITNSELSGSRSLNSSVKLTMGSNLTMSGTTLSGSTSNVYVVLTYNGNGATASPTSAEVAYGGSVSSLPTASKAGYSLDGWYNGSTKLTTSLTHTSNRTFTASWSANTIHITLNNQSATTAGTTNVYFKYGTSRYYTNAAMTNEISSGTITTPTKSGYSFGGYYTGTNGSGTQYYWSDGTVGNSPQTAITSDTTLYAKWTANKIKITINANGGTVGTQYVWYYYNTNKFYSNSACSVQITSITVPTRTGYTFNKLYGDGSSGGDNQESYIFSDGTFAGDLCSDIYKDATLYASWTANKYYVYYNQGSATGGWSTTTYAAQSRIYPNATTLRTNSMTKDSTTADSYTVTYNQGTATGGWNATTYAAQTSVNTTTYSANGWHTSSGTTGGTHYNNEASYGSSSTSNLTLYPEFSSSTTNGGVTLKTNSMTKSNTTDYSRTVTYDANGGSCSTSSNTATKTRSYTANGWTTTSGSTTQTYASGAATGALSGNVTLYPCFTQSTSGGSVTLPTPTRDGYTCKGWYDASSGGNKIGNAGASYTPSADIKLYAQWTAHTYTVEYNGNGATGGNTASSSHTYDTAKNLTTNGYTKTDYTFNGWNTKSDGTGTSYSNGQSVSNLTTTNGGTVTLYAQWKYSATPTYTRTAYNSFTCSASSANYIYVSTTDSKPEHSSTIWFGTGEFYNVWSNLDQVHTLSNESLSTYSKFYIWACDSAGNISDNRGVLNIYKISRSQGTGTTLTTKYDSTASNNGTEFSSDLYVIDGTPIWAKAEANPGYNTPTLKRENTSMTASGATFNATSSQTVTSSASVSTITLTLNNQSATTAGTTAVYYKYSTATYYSNSGCTTQLSNNKITCPTRTGYTFKGYYTGTNGGGTKYIDVNGSFVNNPHTAITSNTTLYAYWLDETAPVTSISSTSNLATADQTITLTATDGVGVTKYYWGTSSSPADSAYTAVTSTTSFSTTKEITSTTNTYYFFAKDAAGNTSASKSIRLYEYTVYDLLENVDGTTNVYTNANYTEDTNIRFYAPYGTTITLASVYAIPTGASADTFKGYSTEFNGTNRTLSTTAPTLTADSKYYMWFNRTTHYLTLTAGYGMASTSGSGTYKYGKTVNIDATVKGGYTWDKWTKNNGNAPASTSNKATTVTITEATTLTASATRNTYTINYVLNSGALPTGTSNPTSYNVETPTFILNNPVRDEYIFMGWNEGSTADLEHATTTMAIPTGTYGNKTYYANWKLKPYYITYNLNGGSSPVNPSEYNRQTPTFTLNNPIKTGYTFTGWTGSNGSSPQTSVSIAQGSTGDKNYTANWSRDTYTISYTLNEGTLPSGYPTSYNIETSTFSLKNPTRTGYTFAGWTGSNGTTAQTSVSITQGSTGNKNYIANWTANTSTAYKVQHWKQKLTGSPTTYNSTNYDLVDTDNLTGTTASAVTPATKTTYTGFTAPSTQTVTISADGSTVVNYYYTRNEYAFTLNNIADASTTGSSASGRYYYGATITLKGTANTGYTWTRWDGLPTGVSNSANTSFTMPAGDVAVTPVVTKNTGTAYTVKHWKQKLTGTATSYNSTNYDLADTDNLGGTTGASVTPATKVYEGFTAPSTQTVTIAADGGTLVNYYYTRNEYSFTLNNVTGATTTGTTVSAKYYYGATITLKGSANAGYTWTRWDGLPTGATNNANTSFTMPASNVTVNPVLGKTTYTIGYTLNGGTASPANPTSYDVETNTITLNNPTKLGYTFDGWTGSNGSTPEKIVKIERGSTGNKTYTANFTRTEYTITYDLNDGTVSPANKATYNVDTDTFTLVNPSKTGYTFTGWTGSNGTTAQTSVSIAKGSTGDKSYTANWSPNTNTTYKVQHWKQNVNGSPTTYNNSNYTLVSTDTDNLTGTTGTSITPATKTYTGFTAPSKQTVIIAADGGTVVDYYYTRNQYTLTLNSAVGASTTGSTTTGRYNYEQTITLVGTPNAGYSWTNWTGLPTGTTNNASTSFNMPAGDVTVTPVVSKIGYSISYELAGGELASGVTNPTGYNVETDTITLNNPTKLGYTFTGWTGSNGTTPEKIVKIERGSTGNKSYTANWNRETYNIAYNLNGGTVSPANKTTYNVDDLTFTIQNPTKIGYVFIGWTGSNGTTLQTSVSITQGSTGDKTFTANWRQADEYTITYDLAGGHGINPEYYNIETPTFTLENPERDGYTFTGWSGTGLTGSNNMTVSVAQGSTGNRTYTAHWIADTHNIYYNYDGGSVSTANPSTYTISTNDFTLNNPTKLGYSFDGWTGTGLSSTPAGTHPRYTNTVTVAKGSFGDRYYTANWYINTYQINYNLNGGTATNPANYNVESPTFTLDNPTKDGYTFIGWSGTGITGKSMSVSIPTGSTGTKNYTANWQANTYKIAYDLVGGTAGTNAPTTGTYDQDVVISNPTRTGYTFSGWTAANTDSSKAKTGTSANPTTGWNGSLTKNTYYRNLNMGSDAPGAEETVTFTANWAPITYSISYVKNDDPTDVALPKAELLNPTTEYNIETPTFKLNNPTRPGYTFTGWTGSNGSTPQVDTYLQVGSTGNKSYTAHWVLNTYTITYSLNDANGSATAVHQNPKTSYNAETATFTLVNPTRTGYIFTGWTGSNGNTPELTVTINRGSYGDKVYTATWAQENDYTITYNLDGGQATNPGSYNTETPTITLNRPTKTGYTFAGWTGSNGTTNQLDVTIPKGSTGNKSYTAHWTTNTYKIAYDLVGGTSGTNAPTTGTYDQNVNISNPTRTGYTFSGWTATNVDATVAKTGNTTNLTTSWNGDLTKNTYYKNLNTGSTTPGENETVVFTANWATITYSITYDLNDNNGLAEAVYENPTNSYHIETETFTLNKPTREGYTFLGWTGSNGRTPELEVVIPKGSYGNKAYTANWTKDAYTITYDLNDDNGLMSANHPSPRTSYYIETDTFTLVNPTRTGYTFTGWTGSNGETPEVTVTVPKGSTGNKYYVANWEVVTYRIDYNLNDSDLSYATQENPRTTYNIEAETFKLNNPTRPGYEFIGWTGSNSSAPQKDVIIERGSYGNKSYTANWEAKTYYISYNLSDDNGLSDAQLSNPKESYTMETASFTLVNPTRAGYTFIGWTGSNGITPSLSVTIPRGSTGNKEYFANWEAITYTITYNLRDENGLSTATQEQPVTTYNIETENILLVNPIREGYIFTGWTGSNGTTPQTEVVIPRGSIGNKEYNANWEAIVYNITYNLSDDSTSRAEHVGYVSQYSIETESFTLVNPTRNGYRFTGWIGSNGNTPELEVTILRGNTGDKNYIATWESIGYSITYNLNDDNGLSVAIQDNPKTSYGIETDTFTIVNPAREGYEFVGWTGSNGNTPELTVTIPKGTIGNKEYTANWRAIVYNITYKLNDENGLAPATHDTPKTSYTIETESFNLVNPTRDGYRFIGWIGSNGNDPQINVSIPMGSIGDRNYIANWELETYTITYDLNDDPGDNELRRAVHTNPKYSYHIESDTFTLVNPTREGYRFTGWTGSNGTTAQTEVTITRGSIGNKTYTANWETLEYSISYDLNDDREDTATSNAEISGQVVKYYINTATFTLVNPTREGFTFKGWVRTDDGATEEERTTPNTATKVNRGSIGNRAYKAIWENITYSITYNLNDNPDDDELPSASHVEAKYSYDMSTETFTLVNPTREGYTFTGWTGSNGVVPQTEVTIPRGTIGNKSYTANWETITYTITYDLNDNREDTATSNAEISGQVEQYNIETATFTLVNPTREGYDFAGWTRTDDNATDNERNNPNTSITISRGTTGNKAYKANWTLNTYSITYDLNYDPDDEDLARPEHVNPKVSFNMETEDYTLVNPTREGYTFTGWTGSNGTTPQTEVTIPRGSIGNKEYTAHWQTVTYTISYNLNDGEATNVTSYTTETATITLNNPVRDGYRFVGWTGSNSSTPQFTVKIPRGSTGDKTYTAIWTQDAYVIIYELNGGEAVNPTSYNTETPTFKLSNPTRDGYTFEGWTGSNGNTPELNVYVAQGSVGDKEFIANWTPITYRVSYDLNAVELTSPVHEYPNGTPVGPSTEFNIETATFSLVNPTRDGYTFSGWTRTDDNATDEERNTPNTSVSIPLGTIGNRNYKANWEVITYSISYNLNDNPDDNELTHAVHSSPKTEYNIETANYTLVNPTRDGYTFAGWTGSNGDEPQLDVVIPRGSMGNKSFTAHWQAVTYTISYNLNDDPGDDDLYRAVHEYPNGTPVGPATEFNIETDTFTLVNPTRIGYTFTGWTRTDDNASTVERTTPNLEVVIPRGTIGSRSYIANWENITYTITYNLNDNPGDDELTHAELLNPKRTFNATTESFILVNPTREAYTFKGWSRTDDNATLEERNNPSLEVTIPRGTIGNREYTAIWEVVTYTITYNLNDDPDDNELTHAVFINYRTEFNIETESFTLVNPTRVGYDFIGWTRTDDNATTEERTTPNLSVRIPRGTRTNRSYMANWRALVYTITYDLNDDPDDNDLQRAVFTNYKETFTIETASFSLVNPTRDGYEFIGWTRTDNGATSSERTYPNLNTIIPRGTVENRSYKANWRTITYRITYNLNDNPEDTETSNAQISGQREEFDVETATFTLVKPTRDGYNFLGWTRTDDNATTEERTIPNLEVVIPRGTMGNRAYIANWEAITYTITYNLNDDPDDDDLQRAVLVNPKETFNMETASFTLVNPSRAGFTFKGWTRTDDNASTEERLVPNLNVVIPRGTIGNRAYTANWETITYRITYNLNDNPDDTVLPRASHKKPDETNVGTTEFDVKTDTFTLINPSRVGYTFIGWTRTDDNATTEERTVPNLNVVIPRGTMGDRAYMANWEADTYTITYNLNDDDGDSKAVHVNPKTTYNIETESFTLVNPTRKGYTFNGWTGSNGDTPQTTVTINRGSIDNKEYTANWTRNVYRITYNLNDDDGLIKVVHENPKTEYTVESDDYTLVTPTRKGYTFLGWTGSNGTTPELNVTIPKGSTEDKSYIAHWEIITYTISYELNGGTVTPSNPVTYNVETETFTLNNPTKYGYDYLGWTGSNGTTPEQDVTIERGSIGNRTYIANWSATVYTITYELNGGAVTPPNPETYTIETPTFTLVNPTRTGYTLLGWTGSNGIDVQMTVTIEQGSTGNRDYTANWVPNEDTKYVVRHWLQKLDGDANVETIENYQLVDTENLAGTTDTHVIPHVNSYEGFTSPEAVEINIEPDGSKIVDYYYIRNSYGFVVETCEGVDITGSTENGTYLYGTIVKVVATISDGYTWVEWNNNNVTTTEKTIEFTMPASDVRYIPKATKDVYTISYDIDGGSIGTLRTEYTVTDEDYTLPTPTKQGFRFLGWTGSNGTEPELTVTIPKGSIGNKTYKANWLTLEDIEYVVRHWTQKLNGDSTIHDNVNYTQKDVSIFAGTSGTVVTPKVNEYEGFTSPEAKEVTIKPDGSLIVDYYYTRNRHEFKVEQAQGVSTSGSKANGIYYYEEPINVQATVMEGYKWIKWQVADEVLDVTSYETTMPDKDLIFTPVATIINYSLAYNLDGGYLVESNPIGYNVETESFTLNNPRKAGYEFIGWTGSNGTTPQMLVKIEKGSIGDRLYTANWKTAEYSINYNLNGGTLTEENPTTYDIETDEIRLGIPVKEGYVFAGWTENDTDEPKVNFVIPKSSIGEKVFTAHWIPCTNIKYTVRHWTQKLYSNAENHDGGSYTLVETETLYGTTDSEVRPTVKTYEGFSNPAEQTAIIRADGSLVVDYFYTRNKYKFTLGICEGVNTQNSTQTGYYYYQEEITLVANVDIDYTWMYWSNGDVRPNTTLTMPANDVIITPTAKIETYKVVFKNGDEVLREEVVIKGHNATPPTDEELRGIYREGYTISWDSDLSSITEDKVINTVWTLIVYNISYELNGGIAEGLSYTYTYEDSITLPLNVRRDGYVFQGWYNNESFEGEAIANLDKGQVGDKKFYAKWLEEEKPEDKPDDNPDDKPEEEFYLTSEEYKIDAEYITEIKPETTIIAFAGKLSTNGRIAKVYRSNGREVANGEFVGTGNIVEITFKEERHLYKLIVKGDLTGEGKVTIADLTTMNNAILGKTALNTDQIKAGDFDKNNRISIADLATLNQYVLGKKKF